MTRIACDIVLLPPREIAEAALRLNRALLGRFDPKIVLNQNDCLPHLSLAMGALREEALPAAADLLAEVASHFPPISLTVTGIEAGGIATGEPVSSLKIERTPSLQALHETVLRRMKPLFLEAAADDFIGFPEVQQTSVDWVNRYAAAAAYDRFSPHITLGVGTLEPDILPLPPPGIATRLALCHLGNYCTCRKILFEIELPGETAQSRAIR
ncbi:MAG: 2'-5' RNA ligase family protein [Nitrospirae bacterium]|nr:2'-5' RNA ligase family protein [Candidatus Manganitrophaceae bacterium]